MTCARCVSAVFGSCCIALFLWPSVAVAVSNEVREERVEKVLSDFEGQINLRTVRDRKENSGGTGLKIDGENLDDKLLSLQLKIESDLNKVEEDAKHATAEADGSPEKDQGKKNSTVGTKIKLGRKAGNKDGDIDKANEKDINAKKQRSNPRVTHSKSKTEKIVRQDNSHDQSDAVRGTRLALDVSQVRDDINALLQTVTEAEWEIERAKAKISTEERVIQQKSAEIEHFVETEKILDDLHKGKFRVDYVTGSLEAKEGAAEKIGTSVLVEGEEAKAGNNKGNSGDENFFAVLEHGRVEGDQSSSAASDKAADLEEAKAGSKEAPLDALVDAVNAGIRSSKTAVSADPQTTPSKVEGETVYPTRSQKMELNPDFRSRVREEMEFLRSGSDPAVMSMDVQLLLDVVTLAITAALFGLVAAFLRLPPTAGFLLGGMLIGPSCGDLIEEMRQVQTLAQFGSIFLLFEQGLLYSQTYAGAAGAASLGTTKATERNTPHMECDQSMRANGGSGGGQRAGLKGGGLFQPRKNSNERKGTKPKELLQMPRGTSGDETEHDPNIVGVITLVLLVFSALTIFVLTDVVSSAPEAIIISSSLALCSTTIVSENLHAAHLSNTCWGKGILKMVAIQDLFMVPLLALPEIIESLYEVRENDEDDDGRETVAGRLGLRTMLLHLCVVTIFVKASMVLAKHVVHAAIIAETRMTGEKGELFTLSVVAYALLMATLSEQLQLSIEAGAVFAGIVLMKSPHVPKILASIQPITSVFGGMYLTSLGMIMSPSFVLSQAGPIAGLVCVIFIFKLSLVSVVLNRFFDYGITSSLAVGSAMAQISEVSLLVLAKGQRLGLVTRGTYLMLIPTTCILLALAPVSTSQLRKLKIQEITGADDGRVPFYLCFLRRLSVLRHPLQKKIPLYNASAGQVDAEQCDHHR